jgi:N-acetylmuramoyl-L-alanine amidase
MSANAVPVTPSGLTPAAALATLGTIVLDPGHGGTQTVGGSKANNATSFTGVKEKKLTLDFCMVLRDSLQALAQQKNKQIKVVLTRTDDVNIGIAARSKFAATHKADLFLALHFNGLEDRTVRGVETYFKEIGNLNLADDKDFATRVNNSLFASLKSIDTQAKNRGVKPDTDSGPRSLPLLRDDRLGNVNRPKKCRACYVELEFITNKRVDELLISGPNASQNVRTVMGNLASTLVDYLELIA